MGVLPLSSLKLNSPNLLILPPRIIVDREMVVQKKSTLFSSVLLCTVISLVLIFSPRPCNGARILANVPDASREFIRISCSTTTYPQVCFNSLASYASTIKSSPTQLAKTALSVCTSAANSSSAAMKTMSARGGMSHRVAAAMRDCMDTIHDSVDELGKSMDTMAHLGGSNLGFQINSIQTWVSAALTDEGTCMGGFVSNTMNGEVKTAVRSHVLNMAQLTSNALAFINALASAQSSTP